MSRLCHHALPGTTSAGFPLTLPAQACVRFILRRYMPIFGWFGWTENCSHRMRPEETPPESVHPEGKLSPDGFSVSSHIEKWSKPLEGPLGSAENQVHGSITSARIDSSQNQRHLFAQFVGSSFPSSSASRRSAFWSTNYTIIT